MFGSSEHVRFHHAPPLHQGFKRGDVVEFELTTDPKKGDVRAKDMRLLSLVLIRTRAL